MPPDTTHSNTLIRRHEVMRRLNISDTTLWRCVQRGDLPPPLKLGRSAYWPESEIQQLFQTMLAKRDMQWNGATGTG